MLINQALLTPQFMWSVLCGMAFAGCWREDPVSGTRWASTLASRIELWAPLCSWPHRHPQTLPSFLSPSLPTPVLGASWAVQAMPGFHELVITMVAWAHAWIAHKPGCIKAFVFPHPATGNSGAPRGQSGGPAACLQRGLAWHPAASEGDTGSEPWSWKIPHAEGRLSPASTTADPVCLKPVPPSERSHRNGSPHTATQARHGQS